jgi:hypothetical protein
MRDYTVKVTFINDLRNRFQILQDTSEECKERSVNNRWSHIAKMYTKSCTKMLSHRKRNTSKEFMQQKTLIAIEEGMEIKGENAADQVTMTSWEPRRAIQGSQQESQDTGTP